MTDKEFDNAKFREGDKIVLKRYFKTETEPVVNVNFAYREINGYDLTQIHQYIPYGNKKRRKEDGNKPQ